MELARVRTPDGTRVVVCSTDTSGALAVVDGITFDDLPALLDACDGRAARIERGEELAFAPEHLASVVGRPRKIICIGLNYRSHAAETGAPLPTHPILFPKWDNALAGPFDDVPLPPETDSPDWEAELAFVFGRRCRRVASADAASVVFGFTCANDLSMRDYQNHTVQWAAGKTWDRGTAVGPVVVDVEQLGGVDPDLEIQGILNGEVRQSSRTSDLIFGVSQLVAYLTSIMTMEPGDLVLTGTPAGVGMGMDPPRYLEPGDVFEVRIEGLGALRSRFVGEHEWVRTSPHPSRTVGVQVLES
jgi:acylpyruvate hydrolase